MADSSSYVPSLHIIESDEPVAESLGVFLGEHGYQPKIFNSVDAFLHSLADAEAGYAIVDLTPPQADGFDVLTAIREKRPDIQVIMVSANATVRSAIRAIKLGAVDFLEKPYSPSEILAAIEAAHEAALTQDAATRNGHEARQRLRTLTPRECAVFRGLLDGGSNKSIGKKLGISARTVEVHRARIMEKLGAHALPEAVRLAVIASHN